MNKYFTKEESENITVLLNSDDLELIKLGFSLIETHYKFKNFKKLIPYNESRIYSGYHHYEKNNVSEEIKLLKTFLFNDYFKKNIASFHRELRHLLRFIKKRTK